MWSTGFMCHRLRFGAASLFPTDQPKRLNDATAARRGSPRARRTPRRGRRAWWWWTESTSIARACSGARAGVARGSREDTHIHVEKSDTRREIFWNGAFSSGANALYVCWYFLCARSDRKVLAFFFRVRSRFRQARTREVDDTAAGHVRAKLHLTSRRISRRPRRRSRCRPFRTTTTTWCWWWTVRFAGGRRLPPRVRPRGSRRGPPRGCTRRRARTAASRCHAGGRTSRGFAGCSARSSRTTRPSSRASACPRRTRRWRPSSRIPSRRRSRSAPCRASKAPATVRANARQTPTRPRPPPSPSPHATLLSRPSQFSARASAAR